jgi:hypothetical protein
LSKTAKKSSQGAYREMSGVGVTATTRYPDITAYARVSKVDLYFFTLT